jgi:hypothetical protein
MMETFKSCLLIDEISINYKLDLVKLLKIFIDIVESICKIDGNYFELSR